MPEHTTPQPVPAPAPGRTYPDVRDTGDPDVEVAQTPEPLDDAWRARQGGEG
jgi:hypothetical protein